MRPIANIVAALGRIPRALTSPDPDVTRRPEGRAEPAGVGTALTLDLPDGWEYPPWADAEFWSPLDSRIKGEGPLQGAAVAQTHWLGTPRSITDLEEIGGFSFRSQVSPTASSAFWANREAVEPGSGRLLTISSSPTSRCTSPLTMFAPNGNCCWKRRAGPHFCSGESRGESRFSRLKNSLPTRTCCASLRRVSLLPYEALSGSSLHRSPLGTGTLQPPQTRVHSTSLQPRSSSPMSGCMQLSVGSISVAPSVSMAVGCPLRRICLAAPSTSSMTRPASACPVPHSGSSQACRRLRNRISFCVS